MKKDIEPGDWTDFFFDQVNQLKKEHCKIYYWKAFYQYNLWKVERLSTTLSTALELIDKSISMIGNFEDVTLSGDDTENYEILNAIINGVKINKVYELAGELSAINGDENKSLNYYQICQYHIQRKHIESEKEKYKHEKFILYSFRRYNEFSIADLINNEISFGKPSVMNDPFDTVVINWSRKEHLKTICEETTHISPFSNSFEYYRLRSFVGNEDFTDYDETYAKILMWSHYADCHKGFCIKYELSKDFVFHHNDETHLTKILIPIKYSDEAFSLCKRSIDYIDAFKTKAKEWKYENEIRLLSYNTQSDSSFISEKLDAKSRIKEIVFGYSCPQSTITTIRNLFKSNADIHFFKMKIDESVDIYTLIKKPL